MFFLIRNGLTIFQKTFFFIFFFKLESGLRVMPFFFFLLLLCVGVHCGIYKSFYNISNISYLNSLLYCSSLSSSLLFSGIVSIGIIFLFILMCTQYLHYIHSPTPFPHLHSPPHTQDLLCPPVL
jgi:hypothetical protein